MKLPLISLGVKAPYRMAHTEQLDRNTTAHPTLKPARPLLKIHLAGFAIFSALLLAAPETIAQQAVFDNSCRWRAEKRWPDDVLLNDFLFDPLVVTPGRREQRLSEAPSTTTIITAEEICRSGVNNIPELLRMVPGLDIFRISASDLNITARGLNSRLAHRMQVYIDGRSVYEDFLNVVFWHELPISLQEIERIEIVKSPISALYGANAFSGVIHIITKSPEALNGTQITETTGNAGTNITNVIHARVHDRFSYKFSFEHDRTNHFPNPAINRSYNDKGREDFRGNVFAEYNFSEWSRASFAAGMDAFDRDLDPGLVPLPAAPPTRVFANGGLGFVKLNYALDDFKFQFAWDRLDMDLRSKILPKEVPVNANTVKLDAQHSLRLGENNILTGGLSYRHHMFDSRFLIGPTQNQDLFSVFLQNEYTPFKELTFTTGLRIDTHPEAGVTVAPRGSIVYSPWKDHMFRASISRAFRSPSVLENFINFGILTGPLPTDVLTIRGNKDLDPEEITSYELGYQTLLFKRLKARVDLFYNDLRNMNTGVTPTGLSEFTVLTQGDGHIFGGEIGLEFLFNDWLKGFANYSYQQRHADPNILGLAPRHKGNVGLSFNLPKRFEADVFMNAVGRSAGAPAPVDPYTTVNLRLGYPFEILGTKARLSFAVANLFNDKHKEFPNGDTIERRITGLLQFRF